MIYRIVVTARANADAIEAFRWKADKSVTVATRWYAGLQKAINKLSTFPERHPVAAEESERFGIVLRQMIYGKKPGTFRILFSIKENMVVLHHIRHGARGPIEPEGSS
ncbi:type II toxin-antitoxin system RelE/ParE family toxin [Singulisphaera rosea]